MHKKSSSMKPVIAIQMVARSILWSLIFSFEIVAIDITRRMPPTYLYYVATIVMTSLLFIVITLRFDDSGLVRDLRELCLFDVLTQFAGLTIHFSHFPTPIYWALCYIVLILKFMRLLWVARNTDGSALVSWPVFGLVGLYTKARGNITASGASPQQNVYAYAGMATIVTIVSLIYATGMMIGPFIPVMAFVVIWLIMTFYKRIMIYLESQYAQQLATEKALAVAEATATTNAALAASAIELSAKNDELEESNRQRDLLVADLAKRNEILRDASHDLAQPLFWLTSCARQQTLATNEVEREACSLELIEAADEFGRKLDDTIHNAKITTKLEAPNIRAISAQRLSNRVWSHYLYDVQEKGLRLIIYNANSYIVSGDGKVRPDTALIRAALNFEIMTDEEIIWRILSNLIINALRNTAEGRIYVAFRKRKNGCWIEVRDTGGGIEGADGPDGATNFNTLAYNVRERQRTAPSGGGHGLGVNNIKQLCAVIGTRMELYSRVGRGSVFRFVVPVAKHDASAGESILKFNTTQKSQRAREIE
jgi:signal transduction histidine kinase